MTSVRLVRGNSQQTDRKLKANATEEFLVRQSPLYEILSQPGMWKQSFHPQKAVLKRGVCASERTQK